MATISSTIQLYDKVTAPINRILGALDNMVGMFESVDSAMDRGFDPSVIADTRREIDLATQEMKELGNATRKTEENTDKLTGSITSMVGAYLGFQSIKKVVDLSDAYVQTEARLKLIVDEYNTIDSLQDKISASAQKSRASYADTADIVAKLSMRTNGLFSNDEAIVFAENLNKLYTIAGASQEEMKSSQLQLLQAMGSGVLRGEEFNAVYEAAPNIMHQVAEAMGTPIEKLREMAADGQITADIVKRALLTIPKETLNAFDEMPMTWGQVWTGFMNKIYMVSVPVLKLISFLAQNWSILEPIVVGLATAVGLYTTALLIHNGVQTASNIAKKMGAIASVAHGAAITAEMTATTGMTTAQLAFNAALYACPLTWILLIIIAVIAAVYAVIAVINKVTKKSISAIGVICGALMTAVAFIWNLIVGVVDAVIQFLWTYFVEPFIGIIEWILNVCNGGFNSFGDAVANLIGQVIGWFLSLGQVVTKIIDAIFGTDWTSGLESLKGSVTSWGKNENAITISREAPSLADMGVGRWAYGDAYNAGYSWGSNLGDSTAEALVDSSAITAENTEAIADALDITNEDLKYLKDLAEREVINRFTTAEIKVDMTNNNNIGGNMDLDGIVEYLVVGVNEAMATAAEGVYV